MEYMNSLKKDIKIKVQLTNADDIEGSIEFIYKV
jgi:hypothetical protein